MEEYLEIEFFKGSPSKIYIKASNGFYSGYTDTYTNDDWISCLAEELRSFPNDSGSIVIFESEKGKGEESDLYLEFYTTSNTGRTEVRICMKAGTYAANNPDEAKFKLKFELSALDKFVNSLEHMVKIENGKSILVGVK